jgi:Flp pilus assembly protein TadB
MQSYQNPRLPGLRGTSWLQRAMIGVFAISLAVVATLFLTVALIAGALIAIAVGVRLWWALRKVRQHAKAHDALEGEYTVLDRGDPSARIERKSRTY